MTNWSAIGKKSKDKGKAYERTIAKALTDFTGVNFRKVPGSGGMDKQGLVVAGHIFCGDVMSDRADFRFSVEAKNRKNFLFSQVLKDPRTAPMTGWWYQCVRDAQRYKKEPMLFFKPKPGSPDNMVVLSELDWAKHIPNYYSIAAYNHARPITFTMHEKGPGERKSRDHTVIATLPQPIMTDWGYFTKIIKPEDLFGVSTVMTYGETVSYN